MTYSDDPFPHWVVDDWLPEDMAQHAYDHWYEGDGAWISRHHLYSRHKKTRTHGCGPDVEYALCALESPGMLAYVSALTGVEGLHSDFLRYGGGQHVTSTGGSLGIHADFTHHPTIGLRRALNVLVYLNRETTMSGALQLWDAEMTACRATVLPAWNRAVIFKTSPTSFHGHPDPLDGPERRSLAAYYYVKPTISQMVTVTGASATQYATISSPVEILMDDYLGTTDYRPRPWEYKLRLRRWLSRRIKG